MKIVSTFIRWLIAPLTLLIVATLAHAEDTKPVLVVSFPSYEKLMADIDFLGQLTGQPNRSQQIEALVQVFTQGQGLKGLDKTKPWGAALLSHGSELTPVAFLPVTNAKDLVDALASVLGPAEDVGGVLKVTPQSAPPMCIRESKGWAFLTKEADSPLPDDPMKLLSGLNSEYDVAARAYLQNVPAEQRKSALEQLKGFMNMAATMQQHGSPMMAELRRKNMEEQLRAIEQFVNEAEQLTLGWNIDTKLKTTHFDFTITAKPGTDLDKQMQLLTDTRSDFAGFLMPESAVRLNRAGKLSPEQIEQGVSALEQVKQQAEQSLDTDDSLSEEEKAALKDLLPQGLDLAQQSIKAGKFDSGATLMLAPGKFQLALGAYAADGPAVEALITKFVDGPGLNAVLKKILRESGGDETNLEGAINKVDLDAYKGIRFHKVDIKLPEQIDEKVRKVFGQPLELYFGCGPHSAYLSVGSGSLDLLKKAIDASAAEPGKEVLPMQASLAVGPIVSFIASVTDDESDTSALNTFAEELGKVKGKDHIVANAKPIPNGTAIRVQVEDGVLEAIAQTSKLRMKGPPGRAGAPGPMRQPANPPGE